MRQPRLVRGELPGTYLAHFANGVTVPLRASRERRYPGAKGEAPDTEGAYRRMASTLSRRRSVLDLGSGSGLGARVLLEHADSVVGLDHDAEALLFACQLAPRARFLRGDLLSAREFPAAEAASMVDVLGHLVSPLVPLRTLRRCMPPGSKVFLSEPLASPNQELRWPARRAFTELELADLARQSGFEGEVGVEEESGLVWFLGQASASSCWSWLEAAERACAEGDAALAHRCLDELEATGSRLNEVPARLLRARLLLASGGVKEAAAVCFELKRRAPAEPRGLSLLGQLLARLGRGTEALELVRKAVELDPASRSAAEGLARVAEELEHSEAGAAWRIAHNLSPDHVPTALGLATRLVERGELEPAAWVLERVQRYGSRLDASALALRCGLLLAQGKRQEAELLRRSIPTSAGAKAAILALYCRVAESLPPAAADLVRLAAG